MTANSNSRSELHEPLIDRALMGLDLAAEHHLANCPCCQGEREKTEQALRRYAEFEREKAVREETTWSEQAARIRAACASVPRRPAAAAVLAPALALLLVLSLTLLPRPKPQAPASTAKVESISDQDLLLAVERAVDSGTPYALEPVALIVDARETGSSAIPQKKVTHPKTRKESASHVQ